MNGALNLVRIAYIGPASGTALHRARALERLGHEVILVDPWAWLGKSKWVGRWLYHAGGVGAGLLVDKRIIQEVRAAEPVLIWVNQGPFLGPTIIKELRNLYGPVVNYTIDDPFNGRDGRRFRRYLQALPYYDLLVVVRDANVREAYSLGARNVLRVFMSADEVAHRPRPLTPEQRTTYQSEVAFVGTWMPERGPFIAQLIRLGVPLSIWGNRWHKAAEWSVIRPHWRGPGIYDDDRYAAIIQSAKVCLGLLSKDNRDEHTTRSMEIPALSGVLCAERTPEHLALYEEGREALFWSDAAECAAACHALLQDEAYRTSLAESGHRKVHSNGHMNEAVLGSILREALHTTHKSVI